MKKISKKMTRPGRTKMNFKFLLISYLFFILLYDFHFCDAYACECSGSGNCYNIGPGQTYANINDFDWNQLQAGDTVRIHYRSTPYREKICIRGEGEPDNPIVVCGVKGPNGELPIISSNNATANSDFFYSWSSGQSWYSDYGTIVIGRGKNDSWGHQPKHITIQGLHLEGAYNEYQYTLDGTTRGHTDGAAGVYVSGAENITIRECVITDNGNGIFVLSKASENELSRDILIEHNYLYGNGNVDSWLRHNLYVQAINATYQYNRFGRNRDGSLGGNLKDRSAGTIIRYNWFEGSLRFIDIVEAQEHAELAMAEPQYNEAYVYGNSFTMLGSVDGLALVHWGFDSVPENTRKGTMYFYNNTVTMYVDSTRHWRTELFNLSTPDAISECFNNVIYLTNETNGQTPSTLYINGNSSENDREPTSTMGVTNLGVNWISNGWENGYGVVNGASNVITGGEGDLPIDLTSLEIDPNGPGHVNLLDSSQSLVAGIPIEHQVANQYVRHGDGVPRIIYGSAMDLGAFELAAGPEMDIQSNGISISNNDSVPSVEDNTDFGKADVTTGSAIKTYSILNTGAENLELSGTVQISGNHSGDFSVTSDPSSPIAPGESTTFQVTFDPIDTGLREASISIDNNDSDENPYVFSIRGTGTTPVLGDLDYDSQVTLQDIIIGLQVAAGLEPDDLRADFVTSGVDVGNDDRVGLMEAVYCMQVLSQLR